MPRPVPLPGPSNLVHPSRTGTEDGPAPAAADGVGSILETGTGDGDRARVGPDPAETPGQVDPDPWAVERRNGPSWEAAAPNRANSPQLIPLSRGWPSRRSRSYFSDATRKGQALSLPLSGFNFPQQHPRVNI